MRPAGKFQGVEVVELGPDCESVCWHDPEGKRVQELLDPKGERIWLCERCVQMVKGFPHAIFESVEEAG